MTAPASATAGTLHYIPPVSAFEPKAPSSAPSNLLLWIGGLGDTLRSVQYPYALSAHLPPDWSLAQANLSSAALGWGTSSLSRDVAEIAQIVAYFRAQRTGKIVIMGHSTGCQDSLHYLCSNDEQGTRARVDGVVLQAPLSDREAIVQEMSKENYDRANSLAEEWINAGRGEDCLPLEVAASIFGPVPVSARRWLSLASPDKKGEDDYFSSDLPDERLRDTFGKITVPLLVLMGEKDQYIPPQVDSKAMVARWIKILKESDTPVDSQSGELLGGATHNLNGNPDEVVNELIRRVVAFLQSV